MIEKSKLIEEVPMGREISDMYLKHPGNESSSDEEGTEQTTEIGMSLAILFILIFTFIQCSWQTSVLEWAIVSFYWILILLVFFELITK